MELWVLIWLLLIPQPDGMYNITYAQKLYSDFPTCIKAKAVKETELHSKKEFPHHALICIPRAPILEIKA